MLTRASLALTCLCLTLLCACSSAPEVKYVPSPPRPVEIPVTRELPPACTDLPALSLPAGTSARVAMEKQHAHIVTLEKQIAACAGGPAISP